MRIYFAHPMSTYHSDLEREALKAIKNKFPNDEIINPAECSTKDIDYYLRLVQESDIIVFATDMEGTIGRGVFCEVRCAQALRKPVWFYNPSKEQFFTSYQLEISDEDDWKNYALAKEKVLSGKELVIIDVETTGLRPMDDLVVEIAAVTLDCHTFKYEPLFNQVCNPCLPKNILEKTWICNNSSLQPDEILDAPPVSSVAEDFRRILGDSSWTAYNVQFERQFLFNSPWALSDNTFPCIMIAATPVLAIEHPDSGIKFPKMEKAHEILVKPLKQTHRALSDTKMEADILVSLMKGNHYNVM